MLPWCGLLGHRTARGRVEDDSVPDGRREPDGGESPHNGGQAAGIRIRPVQPAPDHDHARGFVDQAAPLDVAILTVQTQRQRPPGDRNVRVRRAPASPALTWTDDRRAGDGR